MDELREAFVGIDVAKLRNAVAVADGGRMGEVVRRRDIWHRSGRGLAESEPRLGVDVRRRACGEASGDIRWFFA